MDPLVYIAAANIHRRNLTKSQKALCLAHLYLEPEKGGRGKRSKLVVEFSGELVRQARFLLKHTPDAANSVLAGAKPLSEAYKHHLGPYRLIRFHRPLKDTPP